MIKPKRTFLFLLVVTFFEKIDATEEKVICHIYGDPHLIAFNNSFEQFWCRKAGEFTLLSNDFLRVQIQIRNSTSSIDRYRIEFFKNNATIRCQIDQENQQCDDKDVVITRPSLNQISILYVQQKIHLAIFEGKSSYDFSVRMPEVLVNQSVGLCVEPEENECDSEDFTSFSSDLSREICQHYFNTSVRLSNQLNFLSNLKRIQNAFMACVNDYEKTGDHHFGVSGVQMIIQDGFHHRQLNDADFELQNLLSIPTIESAIVNATNSITSSLQTTTASVTSSTNTVPLTSSATTKSTVFNSTNSITSSTNTVPLTSSATTKSITTTTTAKNCSTPRQSTSDIPLDTTKSNGIRVQNSILFVLIYAILISFHFIRDEK